MAKNLLILGAAGFAREVAWLVADINRALPEPAWNVVGFLGHDPAEIGAVLNGLPVLNADQARAYLPDLYAVAAIGSPQVRERAVREVEPWGVQFPVLIHPRVEYDRATVSFGPGAVVCAGNILTVNIRLGAHVQINLDCTIGHDSVIEDFVTVSPGCHLSGYTTLRRRAYLGTGAVTVEKHTVGEDTVVGAGAAVVRDLPAGVTAVGIPAKPLAK